MNRSKFCFSLFFCYSCNNVAIKKIVNRNEKPKIKWKAHYSDRFKKWDVSENEELDGRAEKVILKVAVRQGKILTKFKDSERFEVMITELGTSRSTVYFKFPAGIYLLKVNNRNVRARCEICSKLTIKTLERRQILVSLLLPLSRYLSVELKLRSCRNYP